MNKAIALPIRLNANLMPGKIPVSRHHQTMFMMTIEHETQRFLSDNDVFCHRICRTAKFGREEPAALGGPFNSLSE